MDKLKFVADGGSELRVMVSGIQDRQGHRKGNRAVDKGCRYKDDKLCGEAR